MKVEDDQFEEEADDFTEIFTLDESGNAVHNLSAEETVVKIKQEMVT